MPAILCYFESSDATIVNCIPLIGPKNIRYIIGPRLKSDSAFNIETYQHAKSTLRLNIFAEFRFLKQN